MQEKSGYLDLMLQLFRTLTTGNFEALYIIFGGAGGNLALLPSVLNLLCAILDGPNPLLLRDKVIEACLITPARSAARPSYLDVEDLLLPLTCHCDLCSSYRP